MRSGAAKPDGFQPADSGDEPCSADPGSAGSPGKTSERWSGQPCTVILRPPMC